MDTETKSALANLIPLPLVADDGKPVTLQHTGNGQLYRVLVGDRFIGGIERRGELDWRLVVAYDSNGALKEVPESHNGPYELKDEAAHYLAEAAGLEPVIVPMSFRDAVTHDIDMTPEQKAHWLGVCDKEGVE